MRTSLQTPNMGFGGEVSSGESTCWDISGKNLVKTVFVFVYSPVVATIWAITSTSTTTIQGMRNNLVGPKTLENTWVTQIKQWSNNRKQHLDRAVHGTCAAWPLACLFKLKLRLYLSLYTKLCLSGESCREQTAWQFKDWAVFWTRPPHQKLSNVKPVSTSRTLEVILSEAKSLYL